MKTSTTKRKAIADVVELLKEESPNAPGNIAGVQLIPIEKVRAFKGHPFRLYEGERLDDMVQSVRDHGILNPVIVQKVYGGYEMLAEILHLVKAPVQVKMVSVKIPAEAEEKYFSGLKAKDRTDLVMHVLEAWFARKEAAYVQQ